MYTHDYDSSYAYGPALPVVELYVKSVAATDEGVSLRALINSGADATIFCPWQFCKMPRSIR
jgi:hypothetical protein